MFDSIHERHLSIICVMFALSPLGGTAAAMGLNWQVGGPQIVEDHEARTRAFEQTRQRRQAAARAGWTMHPRIVDCPIFGRGTRCTRVEVRRADGQPLAGLQGELELQFAAHAAPIGRAPLLARAPGVYLSPITPDRPGLWDVRLPVGYHVQLPPTHELLERVEFIPGPDPSPQLLEAAHLP